MAIVPLLVPEQTQSEAPPSHTLHFSMVPAAPINPCTVRDLLLIIQYLSIAHDSTMLHSMLPDKYHLVIPSINMFQMPSTIVYKVETNTVTAIVPYFPVIIFTLYSFIYICFTYFREKERDIKNKSELYVKG